MQLLRHVKSWQAGNSWKRAAAIASSVIRMAPRTSWGAGRRALRRNHGAAVRIRWARRGFRRYDFVLVGLVDEIGADRLDCWIVQNRSKVRHAVTLQEALANDGGKSLDGQEGRFAQIREHPAGDPQIAMADRAELRESRIARLERGRVRGVGRNRRRVLPEGRDRRQAGRSPELVHEQSADGASVAGLVHPRALKQGEASAPAGQSGDILLAIDRIGHRSSYHRRLGGRRPELLAGVCAVDAELAGGVSLHDEIAGGGHSAAVPWSAVVDVPGFLLFHRIPGEQKARVSPLR